MSVGANLLSALESIADHIVVVDAHWHVTYSNRVSPAHSSSGAARQVVRSLWEVWPDLIGTEQQRLIESAMLDRRAVRYEMYFPSLGGWFEQNGCPVPDGGLVLTSRSIQHRKKEEQFERERNRALELIARRAPLQECLLHLTSMVGLLSPGVRAAVMTSEARHMGGTKAYSDQIPSEFLDAMAVLPPTDNPAGISGAATFPSEPVSCTDVTLDTGWSAAWRNLCVRHNILAVYSHPIEMKPGKVGACLMLAFAEPRQPTTSEIRIAEFVAHAAGLALQRHESEKALRDREWLFRNLGEAMPVMVWTADSSGHPVYQNAAQHAFTGVSLHRLVEEGWETVFTSGSVETVRTLWHKALQVKEPLVFDAEMIRHDGAHRRVHGTASPVKNPEGDVLIWVGTIADVHDQLLTESSLRESRHHLDLIANSIPQLAWMADAQGSLFWYNRRWFEYTGTTLEEMHGWGWEKVHDPRELARVKQKWCEALASGEAWEDIFPLRRHDGEMRWHLSRAEPMHDEQGRVLFWFGTNTDITEQRESQNALLRAHNHLTSLAEACPSFLWVTETDGRLTFMSRRWTEYTGLAASETRDRLAHVVHPDDLAAMVEGFRMAALTAQPYAAEFRLKNIADGAYRWHLARSVPQQTPEGEVISWVGTTTDIHDQKESERVLEQIVEQRTAELQLSNAELESFSYSVAHDLRAPARAVMSTARILLDEFADELSDLAKTQLLRQINAARRMGQLIDDLLHLSRISRSELRRDHFDFSALAEIVVSEALPKHPHAKVSVQPGLSSYGDARLVRLTLQNLVENALKYSRVNVPTEISIGQKETDKGSAFFVADNGIGFDPQFAEIIFQPFQRLHRDEEYEGTGIGLANVLRTVQRHGGVAWAESREGDGATFFFTLA